MMEKITWSMWMKLCAALALFFSVATRVSASYTTNELKQLERSFCLHVSLATPTPGAAWQSNVWSAPVPVESEIRNAARLLTQDYGANRLYLVYQKEMSLIDAERVFQIWREACPIEVDVVPAFQLSSPGPNAKSLFSSIELQRLSEFLKKDVHALRIAVLDEGQNGEIAVLSSQFPGGLIRLGVNSGEKVPPSFKNGVVETWAMLSTSKSDDDWRQPGQGLDQLRTSVTAQNEKHTPVAWSLVPVGTTAPKLPPGDPERNPTLPSGRSTAAFTEILRHANHGSFLGFSSDLRILQISSQAVSHDGSGYAFYEMLKRGHLYVGYYARPFHELARNYRTLRSGSFPDPQPATVH